MEDGPMSAYSDWVNTRVQVNRILEAVKIAAPAMDATALRQAALELSGIVKQWTGYEPPAKKGATVYNLVRRIQEFQAYLEENQPKAQVRVSGRK